MQVAFWDTLYIIHIRFSKYHVFFINVIARTRTGALHLPYFLIFHCHALHNGIVEQKIIRARLFSHFFHLIVDALIIAAKRARSRFNVGMTSCYTSRSTTPSLIRLLISQMCGGDLRLVPGKGVSRAWDA